MLFFFPVKGICIQEGVVLSEIPFIDLDRYGNRSIRNDTSGSGMSLSKVPFLKDLGGEIAVILYLLILYKHSFSLF